MVWLISLGDVVAEGELDVEVEVGGGGCILGG